MHKSPLSYHVSPQDGTQVIMCGRRHLCPLTFLPGSHVYMQVHVSKVHVYMQVHMSKAHVYIQVHMSKANVCMQVHVSKAFVYIQVCVSKVSTAVFS